MLFTAALQLVDPWHVTDVEFRDTDAGGRGAAHHDWIRARLPFPLSRGGMRGGGLPGT